MTTYYQKDVDEWIETHNEQDASELFDMLLPKHRRKLDRLDKRIRDVLAEIAEIFPDAQYCTASGGFNLLLGQSHDTTTISMSNLER